MSKEYVRQNDLKPMALCEPCQGIQRNWQQYVFCVCTYWFRSVLLSGIVPGRPCGWS